MNTTVVLPTPTADGAANSTHICDRPGALSRFACCHFVLMLNDTTKVPLCNEMRTANSSGLSAVTAAPKRFTNSYSTPVYLSMPASEVPEDHITFLFGVVLLISISVFCAYILVRLTKPKMGFVPANMSFPSSMDYDILMWLPRHHRRSSMLLFLRSMACRPGGRPRQTSLSVVSNSSIGLLPTYRSAASSTTITPSSLLPPPAYEELEALSTSQTTAHTFISARDFDRESRCSAADRASRLPPSNRRR